MRGIKSVTVRVYGLLINEARELLISDEHIKGRDVSKFPGGGDELGESIKEALVREFQEELQVDVNIGKHIHTTDFFVRSYFNEEVQVIGVYYKVFLNKTQLAQIPISTQKFDFPKRQKDAQSFRWIPLNSIQTEDVDFDTDKKVIELLKEMERII